MSHVLVGCALGLVRWTPQGLHVVPKAGGDAPALLREAERLLQGKAFATDDVPVYSPRRGFRVEPQTINAPLGTVKHALMTLRNLPEARLLEYED